MRLERSRGEPEYCLIAGARLRGAAVLSERVDSDLAVSPNTAAPTGFFRAPDGGARRVAERDERDSRHR